MLGIINAYAIPGVEKEPRIPSQEDTVNLITKSIESIFGIEDIYEEPKSRKRETSVWPRQTAHTLLKKYTRLPLAKIGMLIGGKDHATVIHSNRTVGNAVDTLKKTGHDDLAMYYLLCEEEYMKRVERFKEGI